MCQGATGQVQRASEQGEASLPRHFLEYAHVQVKRTADAGIPEPRIEGVCMREALLRFGDYTSR